MKDFFIIFLLLTSIAVLAQEDANIHNMPYIEVTGEGKLEVVPNEIYLSIYLNEADRGRLSMEKLESDMLKKLDGLEIDTKRQLKVLNFNSDFNSKMLGQKINTSKGYELMLTETKQVPQMFAELEALNISNINLLRVNHSNREALELQVKILAVRSAKEKAEKMLAELDDKVGRTLFIQEINIGYFQNDQMKLKQEQALPSLDFGTITLQSEVQVRFGIE